MKDDKISKTRLLGWLREGEWMFVFFAAMTLILGVGINNNGLLAASLLFAGLCAGLIVTDWKIRALKAFRVAPLNHKKAGK